MKKLPPINSLLQEKLVTSYKADLLHFVREHPEHFDEAVELAVSDNQPFAWRAAFLVESWMSEDDKRIQKYLKRIVDVLPYKNDGHQRELIKILSKMKLKNSLEGKVFNVCANIWEGIGKDPSVRMTALKFLLKTVEKYPELSNEIIHLTSEEYLEGLSPGVKKSITKLLSRLPLPNS